MMRKKWILLFSDVSSTSVSNPFFHPKISDLANFDTPEIFLSGSMFHRANFNAGLNITGFKKSLFRHLGLAKGRHQFFYERWIFDLTLRHDSGQIPP